MPNKSFNRLNCKGKVTAYCGTKEKLQPTVVNCGRTQKHLTLEFGVNIIT